MRLSDLSRATSFSTASLRRSLEAKTAHLARSGIVTRLQDDRDWLRPAGAGDERNTDFYPVYNDITDKPVTGGPAGVVGIMLNG